MIALNRPPGAHTLTASEKTGGDPCWRIHVSKATLAALAERIHWLTIEWRGCQVSFHRKRNLPATIDF
jgi:hypothetical protein